MKFCRINFVVYSEKKSDCFSDNLSRAVSEQMELTINRLMIKFYIVIGFNIFFFYKHKGSNSIKKKNNNTS